MSDEHCPQAGRGPDARPGTAEAPVTNARRLRLGRVLACLAIAAWIAPVHGASASRGIGPSGSTPLNTAVSPLRLELAANRRSAGTEAAPDAPIRGSSAQLEGGSSADRYGGTSADKGGVAGTRDSSRRGARQKAYGGSKPRAGNGDGNRRAKKEDQEEDQDEETE